MALTYTQSARRSMRSLIARVIADKLVADGIVGKTLIIRTMKDGTEHHYAFFEGRGFSRCAYTPEEAARIQAQIWYPSIIEREAWAFAVEGFRRLHNLPYNVEHYLLPLLRGQIEQLSSDELTEIAMNALLDYGIIDCPIKKTEHEIYYFNEAGYYCVDEGGTHFENGLKQDIFLSSRPFSWPSFNYNVWWDAVEHFEVGMTLEDCVRIYINTELVIQRGVDWSFIDRLVQSIEKPSYEREPWNQNKKTFDRIRVTVNLPRYMFGTWDELKQAVKDNRQEINKKVLTKIETDRSYKKFGLPVNVLQLSDVVLCRNYTLEYIFELKA